MFALQHRQSRKPSGQAAAGRAKRERENARGRLQSLSARDIGEIPDIQNSPRRAAAIAELKLFLESYFPATFRLGWSSDHLKFIRRLQEVIDAGGQYAIAAPRGTGKTAILERAAIWAILTGRRRFSVLTEATEAIAGQSLTRIKAELERNDLLLADFPKAVFPLRKLESQSRRCIGQLHNGERTDIVWRLTRLVMPTMPGPDAEFSGAVLCAAGLTAAVRGLLHVDTEGNTIRPDLLLCDDPQDRESAGSIVQTAERLALLNGDLLGLAGPGQKIAALCAGTVIERDDLIDQLLDREKSPAWTGEKFKMVYSWPTATALWDEYSRLRIDGQRADEGEAESTQFYREHQAEMDAGANVAWPHRFNADELSAIQHAVNLRMDLGDAFDAEYQNEPRRDVLASAALDSNAIMQRTNGNSRAIAGPDIEKVTGFIDVGQGLLWWIVCGWSDAMTGNVMDYGCFPQQSTRIYTARNAAATLELAYSTAGPEGAVYAGLSALTNQLLSRQWQRSDGAQLPIQRILIDAGWATDTVRAFIRQSPHRHQLMPSKGVGIGPAQTPISEYRRRPGEKLGDGWIVGIAGADRLRLLRFDANLWKTRVAGMLTRPLGAKGGITLYGDRQLEHQLLAMHLSSEAPTAISARGVTVNQWARRPDRDNHLWDCLVGAAVAASTCGASIVANITGQTAPQPSPPPRRRMRSRVTYLNEPAPRPTNFAPQL